MEGGEGRRGEGGRGRGRGRGKGEGSPMGLEKSMDLMAGSWVAGGEYGWTGSSQRTADSPGSPAEIV